jgi:hypothetical protein
LDFWDEIFEDANATIKELLAKLLKNFGLQQRWFKGVAVMMIAHMLVCI